jgi:putative ABC transport system permease protein
MVLREGFLLVLIGAAVGFVTALASSRVIASLLFGATARDRRRSSELRSRLGWPLLATLLLARRAARVDPMVALHYE